MVMRVTNQIVLELERGVRPWLKPFLAHEAAHSARHPSRFNRDFGRKRWGDEGYAMEELVALSGQSGRGLSGQLQLPPVLGSLL
jgi:antirestriction protein ArdC